MSEIITDREPDAWLSPSGQRVEFGPVTADGWTPMWLASKDDLAKAWTDGHLHRQRRDPNDGCVCDAWNEGECCCGNFGMGELLSLKNNPYLGGQS